MYGVFKDPVLFGKLEADFHQYYNISIGDLFDPRSTLTVRKIHSLTTNLPSNSRLAQHVGNDAFSIDQHLAATTIDVLRDIAFQTSITASAMAGKGYKKVLKDRPKPMERPTIIPKPKEKKHFITGRELRAMMQQRVQIIAHTDACIKSKVNGPGELNCSCPPESAKEGE